MTCRKQTLRIPAIAASREWTKHNSGKLPQKVAKAKGLSKDVHELVVKALA